MAAAVGAGKAAGVKAAGVKAAGVKAAGAKAAGAVAAAGWGVSTWLLIGGACAGMVGGVLFGRSEYKKRIELESSLTANIEELEKETPQYMVRQVQKALNFDARGGIMIVGSAGCGKTRLLNVVFHNQLPNYRTGVAGHTPGHGTMDWACRMDAPFRILDTKGITPKYTVKHLLESPEARGHRVMVLLLPQRVESACDQLAMASKWQGVLFVVQHVHGNNPICCRDSVREQAIQFMDLTSAVKPCRIEFMSVNAETGSGVDELRTGLMEAMDLQL